MGRLDELDRQYDFTGEKRAYLLICELAMSILSLFYYGEQGVDVPPGTATKLKAAFLDLKKIATFYEDRPDIADWWSPAPRGIPFSKKTDSKAIGAKKQ